MSDFSNISTQGHDYSSRSYQDKKLVQQNRRPIYIALIILGVVGGGVLGLGVVGLGGFQGWWGTAGIISHISQIEAVAMISLGGGTTLSAFFPFAIDSVKRYITKKKITKSLTQSLKDTPPKKTLKEDESQTSSKFTQLFLEDFSAQKKEDSQKNRPLDHSINPPSHPPSQKDIVEDDDASAKSKSISFEFDEDNRIHQDLIQDVVQNSDKPLKRSQSWKSGRVQERSMSMESSELHFSRSNIFDNNSHFQRQNLRPKERSGYQLVSQLSSQDMGEVIYPFQSNTNHEVKSSQIKSLSSFHSQNADKDEFIVVDKDSEMSDDDFSLFNHTDSFHKINYSDFKEIEITKEDLDIELDYEIVPFGLDASNPIENRYSKIVKNFKYEEISQHKYAVVLTEYRTHLGLDRIENMKKTVESNPKFSHLRIFCDDLLNKTGPDFRKVYRDLIQKIRLVIQSQAYKDLVSSNPEHEIVKFVRDFCYIRWADTHLYRYLEDIIQLTTQKDLIPLCDALEDYPKKILGLNEKVNQGKANKKSQPALKKQQLLGALGLQDFCGKENTPGVMATQYFKNQNQETLPIIYARHGVPTALREDHSSFQVFIKKAGNLIRCFIKGGRYNLEEVTADYQEYLRTLESRGQGELYCVHQRRTRNAVEDESDRALQIEKLQEDHKNIAVLIQPVEGEFFKYKKETLTQLKAALQKLFFSDSPLDSKQAAVLPYALLENKEALKKYKNDFNQILEDVQEIFFSDHLPNQHLSETDRETYIFLFYAFQRMDLLFRLKELTGYRPAAIKTICKDDLDRGGAQRFVMNRLGDYMRGEEEDSERKKEAMVNLVGPPILVKKIGAIEKRIKPAMAVENHLAKMTDQQKNRLRKYTFGKEQWKMNDVKVEKLREQSGWPSVYEQTQEKLEHVEGDNALGLFKQYLGFEHEQWEPFDVKISEGYVDKESGKFIKEQIFMQVKRDVNRSYAPEENREECFFIDDNGREACVTDFASLQKMILNHSLVNGEEQNLLQILSCFHQAAFVDVLTLIQKTTWGRFISLNWKSSNAKRSLKLIVDLSNQKKITISSYYLSPISDVKSTYDVVHLPIKAKAHTLIEYTEGENGSLVSKGYMKWHIIDSEIDSEKE
ncbi:MAG: hypothetical protein R3E91_01040 [Chlamydiales bacterium]